MSCYFRHIAEILKGAGIEAASENKQEVDRLIHSLMCIEYKNCMPLWREIKRHREVAILGRQLYKGTKGALFCLEAEGTEFWIKRE